MLIICCRILQTSAFFLFLIGVVVVVIAW